MADYRAIDADGHVMDNRDLVSQYLPASMKAREFTWVPRNSWDSTLGGTIGMNEIDAEQWLKAMDEGGLEQVVLYPTRLLNIGMVQENDVAVALCQAYNQYVHDYYLKVNPRFSAIACIPMQNIPEAVKELRRAKEELGMSAAMLPAHSPPTRPLLGHPMYDPLYAEAERVGMVLAVHANVTNPLGPEIEPFERFIGAHTVVHPFGQMRQFTSIILEGVLERFPRLQMASMEAGATWAPYLMDRLDEEWEKRGAVEAPQLHHKPSSFFRGGRVYLHFEPEEGLLPAAMDYVGDGYFVYASDYPHWDHSYPGSIDYVMKRKDLTEERKVKALRENSRRLYNLKRLD